MLTPDGPVVIDWHNAADGPPALDVALTAVIVAQVAVDPDSVLAEAARALLVEFGARCAISMVTEAVAIRAADPAMTAAEVVRLPAAATLISST